MYVDIGETINLGKSIYIMWEDIGYNVSADIIGSDESISVIATSVSDWYANPSGEH